MSACGLERTVFHAGEMNQQGTTDRVVYGIAPGVLLAGVAGGIAFPILPLVGARAGLSLPFIGMILAANRATRVLSNPLVGTLADRLGGRRLLITGLLIQIVVMGMYVLGIVTGRPGTFFLLGRMLHGPGSACVFVSAQMLALHAGGRAHGGRAASTVRIAMGVGVPMGLAIGGIMADVWGAAHTFEVATAAVTLAALVAFMSVPDIRAPVRHSARLLDALRGFADRRLAVIGVLNMAATFSASGMVLTTMELLVHERHISLFHLAAQGSSGALMAWMVMTEAGTMATLGRWGDRRRNHAEIAAAGIAVLTVALLLTGWADTATALCIGLAMVGLGAGGLGPSLLALTGRVSTPERHGLSVGLLQLCGDVGGTLGPLVGTALFAGSSRTPYFVSAALLALALPAGLWLARQPAEW